MVLANITILMATMCAVAFQRLSLQTYRGGVENPIEQRLPVKQPIRFWFKLSHKGDSPCTGMGKDTEREETVAEEEKMEAVKLEAFRKLKAD